MKRLFVMAALISSLGCVEETKDTNPVDTTPEDPIIKAERSVVHPGGSVETPIGGGGYHHGAKTDKYEGPYSKAPDWAK